MRPNFTFEQHTLPHTGFHSFHLPDWVPPVALVAAGLLYALPALVALRRKHHNRGAITLLNLFLGWTFVGWVAALVWAATAVRHPADPCR